MSIAEQLEDIERRISLAAEKSGRSRKDIRLIAVTKTHPAEMINEAIECGVTDIGENKPQEIRDKFDSVKPVRWHMIGHLQTNKIKYVIDKACLIHSVDSIRLMDEIDRQASNREIVVDILIEINISGEEAKSGISPKELDEMLIYAGTLKNVRVRGLMTVAPKSEDKKSNTLYFKNMYDIFVKVKGREYTNVSMDYLSMGMSNDFEEAIECGANMVRIGSAIFGKRSYDVNL